MSCKNIASLLKSTCTHIVGLWVYAQSLSQKEMMFRQMLEAEKQKEMVFGQMLEDQNQKEMRIVKMTMAETKKK